MHFFNQDTIVAIATPIGRGGIGVLRVSGKLVPQIAVKLFNTLPDPRKAEYLPFLDNTGSVLDRVIVIFFPEPRSFTGENVLEIHGHGGQIILNLLLDCILETFSAVRLANPGEFTERAFLHDKIDLIQAESVADIIDATSYQAARSASNSLQGVFSAKIRTVLKKISSLRVYTESSIDFSDQNISDISYDKAQNLLKDIIDDMKQILKSAYYGFLLKEGIKIVIVGKPNAGKSTLFNALIENDRAIVSEIPGTTRDTLCEFININGFTCYITDTAGILRKSENEVEFMGMQRTWNELKKSDHILWVVDANDIENKNNCNVIKTIQNLIHTFRKNIPITIIRNKSDLSAEHSTISIIEGYTFITISALLKNGIDLIKQHLYKSISSQLYLNNISNIPFVEGDHGNFIARKRHVDILKTVNSYLESARFQLKLNTVINDCFAYDLQLAHQELSKIFGKYTADDLLEKIFGTFCIGK